MCLKIRQAISALSADWRLHGYRFSAGIGAAMGHATLGVVGFENRSDYTALGTVVNLAARLCGEASPDEILIDARMHARIHAHFATVETHDRPLKGFVDPVPAYRLVGLRDEPATA